MIVNYSLMILFSQVNITLEETDTIWILDIPGISVSEASEGAEEIKERNKQYDQVQDFPFFDQIHIFL